MDELARHSAELGHMVDKRTKDLRDALEEMTQAQRETRDAHVDTVARLAVAAEYKDRDTSHHIQRISRYCELLASCLHLPPHEVEMLRHGSLMHDVGKIGTPDSILLKPGKLTTEEFEVMKEHTLIGAHILGGSTSDVIRAGEAIALTHHEKWDGSGYPIGLKGEDIHLWGRICAVADVFDALASKRPYKEAMSNERVYEILRDGRETHFDPDILDVFFEELDQIEDIQGRYQSLDSNGKQIIPQAVSLVKP